MNLKFWSRFSQRGPFQKLSPEWREHIATFLKSQVASLSATGTEYATIAIMVELLHIYYPIGVASGAATGATANFVINRYWAFNAANHPVGPQIFRYVLVSLGSLALNTGGVYLITEYLHIYYFFSVMAVGLIVGFAYNYPLQRFFVYKKSEHHFLA